MMKGVRYGTTETDQKQLLVGSQLQQIARKCRSHSFYVNVLWGHAVTQNLLGSNHQLQPKTQGRVNGPW